MNRTTEHTCPALKLRRNHPAPPKSKRLAQLHPIEELHLKVEGRRARTTTPSDPIINHASAEQSSPHVDEAVNRWLSGTTTNHLARPRLWACTHPRGKRVPTPACRLHT